MPATTLYLMADGPLSRRDGHSFPNPRVLLALPGLADKTAHLTAFGTSPEAFGIPAADGPLQTAAWTMYYQGALREAFGVTPGAPHAHFDYSAPDPDHHEFEITMDHGVDWLTICTSGGRNGHCDGSPNPPVLFVDASLELPYPQLDEYGISADTEMPADPSQWYEWAVSGQLRFAPAAPDQAYKQIVFVTAFEDWRPILTEPVQLISGDEG